MLHILTGGQDKYPGSTKAGGWEVRRNRTNVTAHGGDFHDFLSLVRLFREGRSDVSGLMWSAPTTEAEWQKQTSEN